MPLTRFDPLVAEWFTTRFGNPTEPQIAGWEAIASGRDVLISAPTGSGKTLAAFLICLDRLVRAARQHANENPLPDQTLVVYVSPLKALSNDVHRNLETPLQEIADLAVQRGVKLSPIRTAVRTGDTPASERQRMSKHPPHILVTTPESLYILLTAEKSRKALAGVQTLIVDEIHAIADDKRGSHLSLTLARFDAIAAIKPQRIGLSATVKPIEEVARYLVPPPRPAASIVDVGHRREMGLSIEVPNDELGAIATSEMWDEIYDRLARHILEERTTLVFVNTRRLSERVAHALGERLGHNVVLPHHGSLARALRLDAEQRLKNGELRAVVATASLELGIDIGTVDLVIQIGSPRSIAVALQRVGRSGHWVGARPRGIFFATTRDELIECAAVIRAIREGDLERLEIPRNALDILSQQIVAECACQPWGEGDLFDLVRGAYPYRNLDRKDFDAVINMLSEGIATSRGRSGALLHRDQVNHRVRGRRGARLAAITSGGAIPETAQYAVIAEPEGKSVGSLDEDFAVESLTGDVFLLGTHSWRIRHVGQGKVRVEDAHGAKPSLPFWLGEAPGRSAELSASVSTIRDLAAASDDLGDCGLDEAGAVQALTYLRTGARNLGAMPTTRTVIAERFFDESGGMQLILHAPFGARINRAWGLALRKRFCRTFNFELQAAATDNGIVISLSEQHAFPLETVFEFLQPETVEDVLTQALLDSPMFTARWRWNASRALAILRFRGGAKVPAPIQRMRAEDLLASIFPDQIACAENLTGPIRIPDHPLVKETISNCLHEAMDLNGLIALLEGFEDGSIRTIAVENPTPSVFSHEILGANAYAFLDDAPLEERRARAVQLRGASRTNDAAGILDQAAIEQVTSEVWPEPRDADELHDALLTFVTGPALAEWQPWFAELYNTGRASIIDRDGLQFWVATERRDAIGDTLTTIRGWMEFLGPITASELAARLAIPQPEIEIALAALEAEGQVFQGHYRNPPTAENEWCNRRILARIHRMTMGRLRSEIAPVTAAQFHQFLFRWQHVAPGTQLHGADGVLQIVRQLQGFEIPASAWEPEIFSRRIVDYSPENLDDLCLSGEVAWARLSPHPALAIEDKRVRPTRIAPITFFLREDAEWLAQPPGVPGLSHAASEVYDALTKSGASFFNDLVRATKRLPSEVEDALWELTAGGLVTADGFENIRAILYPKRGRRTRHAAGRWSLVNYAPVQLDTLRNHANQLLLRWGVLFRDMLTRETVTPPWRELLPILRRMEAQGEIRGGRFVSGFTGEQFARPEAIDLLRAVRRAETEVATEVSPADPLNLTGIILPGPRTPSNLLVRSVMRTIAVALLLVTIALRAADPPPTLRGYPQPAAATEVQWEKKFRDIPQPDRIRENMRRLSARPHHVGSPYDKDNAEWILANLKAWGLDAKIETFDTLFPTPLERSLDLIEPVKYKAKLEEPALPEDPTSNQKSEQLPTYNAYSIDGDVTGPVVYVNYGAPADYEELERHGVSVSGAIVLVRYGQTWRGIKPKLAAEHGAIACLIYSDPRDDGYFRSDIYPKGPMRPPFGVQRGSVMDMPVYPGDPQTPGVGAIPNAQKIPLSQVTTLTKIPVMPISYEDAEPLLKNLSGDIVPEAWRGGLPFTYHLGPGPAKAHLHLKFNWDRKPLYDVIARIPGSKYPDEWVIRGNHHDAWVNGADDPLSGASPEMEEARAFGELLKQGWKPDRTIIYCFWDGEEPGLLGSTEWAETHDAELKQHAVAYINSDGNGRGLFSAEGSHSLENFVNGVVKDIQDPESGMSVWKRQRLALISRASEERRGEIRSRPDTRIGALGSGSDYSSFLDHLGVASLNIAYGGEDQGSGQYHSIYDDFYYYTHFMDTDFAYGKALAQTAGTMMMRLADAEVLPFQFTGFADTVHTYITEIKRFATEQRAQIKERNTELEDGTYTALRDPKKKIIPPSKEPLPPYVNFAPLDNAADELTRAAEAYEKALTAAGDHALASVNAKLIQSERLLTDSAGLPNRPWYQHLIYAPGYYTGYGVKTIPGVREAIEQKRPLEVEQQVVRVSKALQNEADLLDAATAALVTR